MQKQATSYLIDSAQLLRANVNPLLLLALMGLIFSFPSSSEEFSAFGLFLPMIIVMIFYPLVYGRYSEIIQGNPNISYYQIFNKHWFNFFIVNLIVGSPALIINLLGSVIGEGVMAVKILLWFLTDIMTIYIIPLVFLLNRKISSVSLGIKCLFGNLRYSIPLMVLVLFPSLLSLIVRNPYVTSTQPATAFLGNYLFWILNLLFDFTIFIAATLILKERLLIVDETKKGNGVKSTFGPCC